MRHIRQPPALPIHREAHDTIMPTIRCVDEATIWRGLDVGCEVAFEAAGGFADHLRTARAAAKQSVQDRPVSSVLTASVRPARGVGVRCLWRWRWWGSKTHLSTSSPGHSSGIVQTVSPICVKDPSPAS